MYISNSTSKAHEHFCVCNKMNDLTHGFGKHVVICSHLMEVVFVQLPDEAREIGMVEHAR